MSPVGREIRPIDLHDDEQTASVLALQYASYRVEADLIGYADLPPLRDTIAMLKASDELFWGCFVATRLAGATSYKVRDDTCDIHRLMVHPDFFRQGIAQSLLWHLRQHMATAGIRRLIISTGRDNLPACTLYRTFGFHAESEEEVVPGLFITHFALKV